MTIPVPASARPRLARGVRLRHDPVRGPILLAPERVLTTNSTALAILKLCDGTRTLEEVVEALGVEFSADRARIAGDVEALLTDLAARRMVEW